MKKLSVFFILLIYSGYIYADTEPIVIASTAYVQRILDELDTKKQDVLATESITETGVGPNITSITANNGTVTITRGGSAISVGTPESATYAQMWLE